MGPGPGLSAGRLREAAGFYEGLRWARDEAERAGRPIEPGHDEMEAALEDEGGWGAAPRSREEYLGWVVRREMGRIRGGSR